MAYRIEFSDEAKVHLKKIRLYDKNRLLDEIQRGLKDQPEVETKNRKPLRPNKIAKWELRVGMYRVLYNVENEQVLVMIVGVGDKFHNRLWIGGEEVEL